MKRKSLDKPWKIITNYPRLILHVRSNIPTDGNGIPFHRTRHLRRFGSHFQSRMFYFPLHFTCNQKHMECFICKLPKQIKQAIRCWREFIPPVHHSLSSLSKLPSLLLFFPPAQSSRLIAVSVPSVSASTLSSVIGVGFVSAPDVHYPVCFLLVLKMCRFV